MSSRMTKVVRYKCEWCGKEFKTPHLHKCKWDVDAHNCLSCKHRGKYVQGTPSTYNPYTFGVVDAGTSAHFECPFNNGGGGNDFDCGATDPNGNGCEHWEQLENYKGKKSFAEIESERRLSENPGEFKDLAEFHQACEGHRGSNDNNNSPFPF